MPGPRTAVRKRVLRATLSVRGLMVLVLAIASVLGWFAHRANLLRESVERIEQAGGRVEFLSKRKREAFSPGLLKGQGWLKRQFAWEKARSARPLGTLKNPGWLVRHLGWEYGDSVASVDFDRHDPGNLLHDFRSRSGLYRVRGSTGFNITEVLRAAERLPSLSHVSLLRAHLDAADVAALAGATGLHDLYLFDCSFDTGASLDALKSLKSLESCTLRIGSPEDKLLAWMAGVASLKYVFLQGPGVTDATLAALEPGSNLEMLSLEECDIAGAGLGHLRAHKRLSWLVISDARLESLESLRELPALETLDLSFVRPKRDDWTRALLKLVGVKELSLFGTEVSDRAIYDVGRMQNLKELSLMGTGITDECLGDLKQLEQLQRLDVSNTAFSSKAADRLRRANPKLKIER